VDNKFQNRVYLTGNLAVDAEAHTFAGGGKKVTLRLAVSDDYKPKDSDEWVKRDPVWVDLQCWRDVANEAETLKKGDRIALSGKLKLDTWEDKATKQKRSKHYIDVFEFELQEKKGGGEGGAPRAGGGSRATRDYQADEQRSDNSQDIPF
jgi:single-strand DNA-binding protein